MKTIHKTIYAYAHYSFFHSLLGLGAAAAACSSPAENGPRCSKPGFSVQGYTGA